MVGHRHWQVLNATYLRIAGRTVIRWSLIPLGGPDSLLPRLDLMMKQSPVPQCSYLLHPIQKNVYPTPISENLISFASCVSLSAATWALYLATSLAITAVLIQVCQPHHDPWGCAQSNAPTVNSVTLMCLLVKAPIKNSDTGGCPLDSRLTWSGLLSVNSRIALQPQSGFAELETGGTLEGHCCGRAASCSARHSFFQWCPCYVCECTPVGTDMGCYVEFRRLDATPFQAALQYILLALSWPALFSLFLS